VFHKALLEVESTKKIYSIPIFYVEMADKDENFLGDWVRLLVLQGKP